MKMRIGERALMCFDILGKRSCSTKVPLQRKLSKDWNGEIFRLYIAVVVDTKYYQ